MSGRRCCPRPAPCDLHFAPCSRPGPGFHPGGGAGAWAGDRCCQNDVARAPAAWTTGAAARTFSTWASRRTRRSCSATLGELLEMKSRAPSPRDNSSWRSWWCRPSTGGVCGSHHVRWTRPPAWRRVSRGAGGLTSSASADTRRAAAASSPRKLVIALLLSSVVGVWAPCSVQPRASTRASRLSPLAERFTPQRSGAVGHDPVRRFQWQNEFRDWTSSQASPSASETARGAVGGAPVGDGRLRAARGARRRRSLVGLGTRERGRETLRASVLTPLTTSAAEAVGEFPAPSGASAPS